MWPTNSIGFKQLSEFIHNGNNLGNFGRIHPEEKRKVREQLYLRFLSEKAQFQKLR